MNSKAYNIINELKGKQSIPNFVVFFFIISLLIVDFLPYFKSLEIINPQFLYLSVLNLIFGLYYYFNSSRLSNQILPILKRSYVFKIYLVFLLLCGLSFFSAKNTSLVITKFTEIAIVFCLFINLSILLKDKLDLFYKIVFIICISAFIQSWQQLCHFIIIPKHASIIDLLTNLKGNTGNINILAASLTIKVPFLLLGITHFKSFKKWFLLIALFSVTSVILLTGARTPYISLVLIYLIFSAYLLKENSFQKISFIKIITLVIPVLIAMVFVSGIFEKSKDTSKRYSSIGNRAISTEDASAQARLNYWKNSIEITKTNPIFGIGLGNYQVESIPYEKYISDEFIVSLHAHNDFLEICCETGIINALVYLSLFIFIFFINAKRILKSQNSEIKTIALLTLLLLVVYGVDSFFNFPMYRPTMQIIFALLLALTVVNSDLSDKEFVITSNQKNKYIYVSLICVACLTSYSAFIIFKASNLEYLITKDDINFKDKGALTGDEVLRRMPKFPNVFQSAESFYEYAGIYYVREKNYEKAMNCFSKATKINPYTGRINFFKYIIANKKGNSDSAYIYSKQAFYLRPRNYSLYRASIFAASGRKDATEIIKQHKIFSKYIKSPEAWTTTVAALQNAGLDQEKLVDFINDGVKVFPNDSTLLKQKNSFLITKYIIEAQKFQTELKLDKALETYKKALKIDPENIYVSQNLGFYYFNQGQNEKAIAYFLNAIKKPGLENGKTEYFLGICYMKLNDKKNACKFINLAKNKNYSDAKLLNPYCEIK
jgi:O-antigen ligase/Flp pilus assembly protein TadD